MGMGGFGFCDNCQIIAIIWFFTAQPQGKSGRPEILSTHH
jgi:hypothetical protein